MGYDMRWRKSDEAEQEAVRAAREVWNAAIAARDALPEDEKGRLNMDRARASGDFEAHENWDGRSDRYRRAQDAVMEASRAQDEAEQSYFRLNVWGMSRFADVMYELGMAFEDDPHPDWPKVDDYGITHDQVEAVEYPDYDSDTPLTDEQREAATRYLAEQERVLMFHGRADTPGIPLEKFSSNDGWIVLPAECKGALAIYMAKLNEIGQDDMANLIQNKLRSPGKWAQWLHYLQGAITHDGFEVH